MHEIITGFAQGKHVKFGRGIASTTLTANYDWPILPLAAVLDYGR